MTRWQTKFSRIRSQRATPRDRDNFRFRTPRTLVIKISYLEYPLSDLPLASAHPICTIMRISLCALCNLDCRSLREFFMGRCIIQRESLFHAPFQSTNSPSSRCPPPTFRRIFHTTMKTRNVGKHFVTYAAISESKLEFLKVISRKKYFKLFHLRL